MKLITVIGLILLIVFAAPVMARPNLAANGINHIEPHPAGYEWVKFLDAANAEEVPNLYVMGTIYDSISVSAATPEWKLVPSGDIDPMMTITWKGQTWYMYWFNNDNNGLSWFEAHGPVYYDTVFAYSGGTRTVVTAILADYLECDRLVLISPVAGTTFFWKDEIEYIKSQHPSLEIIIYQSDSDFVPAGIKFDSSDNAWLTANDVTVNPGIPEFGNLAPFEVNQRKIIINDDINDMGHVELFQYISGKLRSNDLIFLIDTTGSMWDDIANVQAQSTEIVNKITTVDPANQFCRNRIAVATYRDWPIDPYGSPGDSPYLAVLPFTTDKSAIIGAIQSLPVGGGNDEPEAVYYATIQAIHTNGLNEVGEAPGWQGGTKNIVVMGDAPSHNPDPISGDTYASVKSASDSVDPVIIYTISIGSSASALEQFTQMSEGTGGKVFTAPTADEIVEAITKVISDVSEPENYPPNVSGATASVNNLWPPNHKMIPVQIMNVIDPDGDPVTITITGITQDERVAKIDKDDKAPDGAGIGTSIASIRAERSANGDGRVYEISFTASDGKGGLSNGHVYVGVPHDQGKNKIIIDSGQNYDSTQK